MAVVFNKALHNQLSSSCKSDGCCPVLLVFFSPPPASVFFSPGSLRSFIGSDPFLHGALAVQYVARRALPFELHHGIDQHH